LDDDCCCNDDDDSGGYDHHIKRNHLTRYYILSEYRRMMPNAKNCKTTFYGPLYEI